MRGGHSANQENCLRTYRRIQAKFTRLLDGLEWVIGLEQARLQANKELTFDPSTSSAWYEGFGDSKHTMIYKKEVK